MDASDILGKIIIILLILVILLGSIITLTKELLIVLETETTIDSVYVNGYTGEIIDHVITTK